MMDEWNFDSHVKKQIESNNELNKVKMSRALETERKQVNKEAISVQPGNTNWRGRLCTVDLLIKITWFVKMFVISKVADLN